MAIYRWLRNVYKGDGTTILKFKSSAGPVYEVRLGGTVNLTPQDLAELSAYQVWQLEGESPPPDPDPDPGTGGVALSYIDEGNVPIGQVLTRTARGIEFEPAPVGGGGSSAPSSVLTKSANYQMSGNDGTVLGDASGGSIVISLPPVTEAVVGFSYRIKRVSNTGGTVSVAPVGGAKIDGIAGNVVLTQQWSGLIIYSNGTDWFTAISVGIKHPPVAAFTASISNRDVTILTNTSHDPDGDSLTYLWNWGDGQTSTTATPTHTYGSNGNFTITLTVTDATGMTATASQQVEATTGGSGGATGPRMPFASTSEWNKTFAQRFGSNAAVPIHPENDLIIEALRRFVSFPGPGSTGSVRENAGDRFTHFRTDVSQFTPAVYIVQPGWTYQTVRYTSTKGESSDASTVRSSGGGTIQVPLPTNVSGIKPTPPIFPADSGSDAQMTIWDRDNVMNHASGPQFWDGWQWSSDGTGAISKNGSGEYVVTNISHFIGEETSSGVPGNTPSAYVSRGAGTPYMAGHVFESELTIAAAAESQLAHMMACAHASPDNIFVPPASKSDGSGLDKTQAGAGNPYSPPEGAILKLDEDFDIASLPTARIRAIARTARDRGFCLIDNTGNPKAYWEAAVSARNGAGWETPPTVNELSAIPFEAMNVVDWQGGDSGRTTGSSGWGTGSRGFSAGLSGGIAETPVVVGSVVGSSVAGSTVVSASQTPAQDELMLAIVAQKNTFDRFITGVSGNGQSRGWGAGNYRSLVRRGVHNQNGNGWVEALVARAPAGVSAGALTLTHNGGASPNALHVLRLTPNAKPIRVAVAEVGATDSANPQVRLLNTGNGNAMIGVVMQRSGIVSTVDSASGSWTQIAATVAGSLPERVSLTTFSLVSSGGTVIFKPTLSTDTEWVLLLIEIT